MKVIILAGGFGTRISEESYARPKPMIEIGGKPILWHIMKIYSYYGFNDFIICCGYKQHMIKEWFADYYLHTSDVTFDFTDNGKMTIHNNVSEPWKVTLVDTGLNTMTGGRIKAVKDYIGDETFMLTYGDGVADVNLEKVLEFHKKHGRMITMTAVNIGQKFGVLDIKDDAVTSFREKNNDDGDMINGGFMVCNPQIFEYLDGPETVFEKQPLENAAKKGELMAYKHDGFWMCMDTQRDKKLLEDMWENGTAPWRIW